MKFTQFSKHLACGCAALLLLGTIPAEAAALSPALDHIAADFTMAKSGLTGTELCFSGEDFAVALGVESVGKIVITELPDLSVGHLRLGGSYVTEGQVIAERNLDALKFVPYGDTEATAQFRFCRGGDLYGTAYTCSLYTLDTVNTAPVIAPADAIAASAAGEIPVYSGVTHLGTIPAHDAEGDALTFEILSHPDHGTLKLTDRHRGYYEYTADAGYTGPDSFTVRAVDCYGGRSPETKLMLRADAPEAGEVYADMDGHWAAAAAISCVRAGVIDAPEAGECFWPEEDVSRAEFLTLAMKAAGYDGFAVNTTGFADDADIPEKYRGFVAAASALGIVDGVDADGVKLFCPNNRITRSEAALIVSRLTGIGASETVAVFADESVPAWASGAMAGLRDAGILRGSGDGLSAYGTLTRAAAIQLAASVAAMR